MQSSGCAGLLPPLQHNWCCGCQQLLLGFLRVCLLSADGSAAPLPRSRMKCSLAASSQPKPLLPWPTALGLSPSQFLSQCINQPRLAGFSDAAPFIPGWTHTSNLFSTAQQPWQSRPPSGVSIFAAFSSGGAEKWQQTWAKQSQKASECHPFYLPHGSAANMCDLNHWLLVFWSLRSFRKFPGKHIQSLPENLMYVGRVSPNQVQDEAQDMGKCNVSREAGKDVLSFDIRDALVLEAHPTPHTIHTATM